MKILLFGVSQVGKSTVAAAISEKLKIRMIDIDYYIIDKYGSVENFQMVYQDLNERLRVKTDIIISLCRKYNNIVIPVSPIYSIVEHKRILKELANCIKFNLVATPKAIFERTGYYDEKGKLLPFSEEYKMLHKDSIIAEIINDNFSNFNEFRYYEAIDTTNLSVDEVASLIIKKAGKNN